MLEARPVSYGKATSYLPVIDLLRGYFRIGDRDTHRDILERVTGKILALDRALEPTLPALLALLDVPFEDPQWQGLDPSQRRQRTLDAVKRLVLRETQAQPLLVVVEDLHWIDTETQALLDSLVESLPTAPLLLLVDYRPEYRHAWGSKMYYTQLRLDPLSPESAEELLDALLGHDASLEPFKTLLDGRTERNPFFLEESVRTLVETQVLLGERGAYRLAQPVDTIQVPATVQTTLACAHRPPAARGEAAPGDRRGHWQGRAICPPPGHCRGDRGDTPSPARPPPDGGVPLRDAPVPRPRVHLQARPHSRGHLRQSAAGSPPCASRADRGRDRDAPSGSSRRADRAARPSRPPGRAAGEGGALSPAGRKQGGRAVGAPGRPGLVRAGAGCPRGAAGEPVHAGAGLRHPPRAAVSAGSPR